MRNLYCYSDEIIYQTSNQQEFNIFEQQAKTEGLQTVYGEYFPYELSEEGKILLDENKKQIPLSLKSKIEKGILSLDSEKKRVKNLIDEDFEKSFNSITRQYPQSEREGWSFLIDECNEWLTNKNKENIPGLYEECNLSNDDNVITNKANSILEKSNSYKTFYGKMKALKNSRLEKLEKATIEELINLEKELSNNG